MCGIAGWFAPSGSHRTDADLLQMLQAIQHRGPDDRGTFSDKAGGVALGHNRLSIIDLSSAGHQPMTSEQTDDVLIFNGEIYNFVELRTELTGLGHRFRSRSDTEVLLYAIASWGIDCLSRIRGMYAFALWRPREQALYLARDPIGIKPLYYTNDIQGGVIFASEIKGLLALSDFKAKADTRAIRQFLEFGYTFELERTAVCGVSKLPAGHYLRVPRVGPAKLVSFFEPNLTPLAKIDVLNLEEELYGTLSKVVAQHLITDVPVGLLLSGGIDSSIIAAIAAKSGPITTITMGFSNSTVDERPHARAVAEYIGSRHEEVIIDPQTVEDELANAITCFDDLFADWGTVSTKLLYGKCRERGIKVVLVGEGADEMFGGYDIFRRANSKLPTEAWIFELYRHYSGRRYGRFYGTFRSIMRSLLANTGNDRFSAIRQFEARYQLPNNYVSKVDRASMAVSIEARVPFLDQRIVETAYRIPQSFLTSNETEKNLLRGMAERYRLLPKETLNRRKFGGSIAISWMDEHARFRQFARETILKKDGWTDALGLKRPMIEYFEHKREGYRFPHSISIFRNLAWRLLLLELWSSTFRIAPYAR